MGQDLLGKVDIRVHISAFVRGLEARGIERPEKRLWLKKINQTAYEWVR